MGIRHHVAVVLLLILFAIQCLRSLPQKAPTFDEVLFIPSGYAFLRTGSTLTNPEAQPLPRILSALPLLMIKPQLPAEEPVFEKRYQWGADFLFQQNGPEAERIVFWARVPVIILGLCLLLIVFQWSRTLFGLAGALISLAFASVDPNLIAHSSLATSDLPFTFFFIITLYLYVSNLRASNRFFTILLTSAALGAALLCKTTAWLLLPMLFLILAVLRPPDLSRALLKTSAIIVIALVVVNAAFIFQGTFHDKAEMMRMLTMKPEDNFLQRMLLHFLPDKYAFAFLYNLAESSGRQHPFPFFLHGHYSNTGFWNYFLVALLIKTPVPVLIWLVVSLFFLWNNPGRKMALVVSLPWLLLLLYFSFVNKLNLGLRHILPVYPLWYVAAGASAAFLLSNRKRFFVGLFAICLLWSCFTAYRIHPYQLAYFNELTGGPANGYQYLVDSNLDWGQDLARLKEYMQKRNLKCIYLSYFGTADPLHYRIDYDYLPSPRFQPWTLRHPDDGKFELKKGVYAISATNLQGVYLRDRNTYAVFKNKKPDDTVGYSILIYRY